MSLTIFQYIDRWFNPWKYDNEAFEAIEAYKNPSKRTKGKTAQEVVDSNFTALRLRDQDKPFTAGEGVVLLKDEPWDNGLYHHDFDVHQVMTKYDTNSGKRYQARNGSKRKKIKDKLLLYPKKVEVFDMTHVQNIGFHGTDDDIKMLVGWDSNQNRQDMRKFEEKVIEINKQQPIYWYVSIELQSDFSAIWKSEVYNIDGEILLEQTFHDSSSFRWIT